MDQKTDNHDPRAKLALRRHFLAKYHADGSANVLDCCQGGGLMWAQLRKEFRLAGYWGLDVKPKKGRMHLDSVRVLAQAGWPQNVVDIDTYGMPWKHWEAMLPNIRKPTTVFLTVGQRVTGTVGRVSGEAIRAVGLVFPTLRLPAAFHVRLADVCVNTCLARTCIHGIIIIEAAEIVSGRNARYIGLRLEKGGPAESPAQPASNTPTC